MIRRSMKRALAAALFALAAPVILIGCPKKEEPKPEVEPTPPATNTAPVEVMPAIEDAGEPDVNEAAPPKKHTGPSMNTNQYRAKQCCSALRKQAKALGNSPEGAQLMTLATQCDAFAMQMGPTSTGQAPELMPLRLLLKGQKVPAVCSGL